MWGDPRFKVGDRIIDTELTPLYSEQGLHKVCTGTITQINEYYGSYHVKFDDGIEARREWEDESLVLLEIWESELYQLMYRRG